MVDGLVKTNIATSVISNSCVWPMISLGSLHLFKLQREISPPPPRGCFTITGALKPALPVIPVDRRCCRLISQGKI